MPDDRVEEVAVGVADDEVIRLLDDVGWAPRQVALITTGSRHWTQVSQQETYGQQGYRNSDAASAHLRSWNSSRACM